MTADLAKKCSYFNSGYCKFTRKENGCKYYHPTEACTKTKCNNKSCDKRHPKKCRHGDQCRFRTRCLYKHFNNDQGTDIVCAEGSVKHITEEISKLRSEISTLKKENDVKINKLVKVHLKELEDLKPENNILKNNFVASKDVSLVTLATMEKDLTEAKQSIKDYG